MPNWNTNCFAVIGKKEKIVDFLNGGRQDSGQEQYTYDTDLKTAAFTDFTLQSWYPMPDTFKKWDTTNSKLSFKYFIQTKKLKEAMRLYNIPMTKEGKQRAPKIIWDMPEDLLKDFEKDYKKYCDGYDKAVKYQQDKYGCVGWYDYNCKTLGTKWNAPLEIIHRHESNKLVAINLECQTAWTYPAAWIKTISQDYPDLTIICYTSEESGEYCGFFNSREKGWIECIEGCTDFSDIEEIESKFFNYVNELIEEMESD